MRIIVTYVLIVSKKNFLFYIDYEEFDEIM